MSLDYTVLRSGRRVAKRQYDAAMARTRKEEEEEEKKSPNLDQIHKKMKKLSEELDKINARPISSLSPTNSIARNCADYHKITRAYEDILEMLNVLTESAEQASSRVGHQTSVQVKLEIFN